ncbi:MAG: NAD(P)H-dependent oxidoreductase [Thaumarchaeota archaeon]|nr:NAD(P)H-dependent oxidoreductase [Nitrososphaerota archaeon]
MYILAISGSYRKGSYNLALLEQAKNVLPENTSLEIFDVSKFPLFSKDLEQNPPENVLKFKEKISSSDAILIASPEHNHSITAVLKNAIEWGNRPDNSWDGKPAAIISVTVGIRGGVRSQENLRLIMVDLNMHPINKPEFLLGRAREVFDDNMKLKDDDAKNLLRIVLQNLVSWAAKINKQ